MPSVPRSALVWEIFLWRALLQWVEVALLPMKLDSISNARAR